MSDLNLTGESYAHSLIAAGKVDRTSPWSFEPSDGNALLGKNGDDWESYSKVHLGLDRSANEKTKARYKYPIAKSGKLFRSGVIAAKQRAAQQSDGAVEKSASALLATIDKAEGKSNRRLFSAEGRAFAPFEYKFATSGPDGTFEGYGAAFNNEDDGGDMLLPGCFDSTLAQHKSAGTMPKMLLQHGGMAWGNPTPEDMLPIGKWTDMAPDSHGLQTKGRLINLDTESGKRIYGAMKEGELSGLSMGYKAAEFTRGTKANEPARIIKTVNPLFEVSPVTFPMNAMASVTAVKTALPDIKFLERVLRDAGQLSRTEAKALLAEGYKGLPLRDVEGGEEELAAIINRAAALIRL